MGSDDVASGLKVPSNGLNVTAKVKVKPAGFITTVGNVLFSSLFMEKKTLEILHDVKEVVAANSSTIVVGGVGSGVTSLLKVLAGQLSSSRKIKVTGSVPVGSSDTGTSSDIYYCPSIDSLESALTIRETITEAVFFANNRQCPRLQAKYIRSLLKSDLEVTDSEFLVDYLIKELSLKPFENVAVSNCPPTLLKILTLIEGLLSGYSLLVYDDDTGLASSDLVVPGSRLSVSPNDIAKAYSKAFSIAREAGITLLTAMRVPAASLVESADNILILSHGRVLFHGSSNSVESYLAEIGLSFPPFVHLGERISSLAADPQGTFALYGEERLRAELSIVEAGKEEYAPVFNSTYLHNLWEKKKSEFLLNRQSSHVGTKVVSLAEEAPCGPLSFGAQFRALFARRVKMTKRMPPLMRGKFIGFFIFAWILAALLYNPVLFNPAPRIAIGMMTILITLSLGNGEVGLNLRSTQMVIRHSQSLKWYSPMTYMLATSCVYMLVTIVTVLPLVVIPYFMVNFVYDAGRFFFYYFNVWALGLYALGWAHLVPVLVPNTEKAGGLYMMAFLFCLTASGMLLPYTLMPPAFRYFSYWLNPGSWFLRSLVASEYSADRYNVYPVVALPVINGTVTPVHSPITYSASIANSLDFNMSMDYKWAGPFFMIGASLSAAFFAAFLLTKKKPAIPQGGIREVENSSDTLDVFISNDADISTNAASPHYEKLDESQFRPHAPLSISFDNISYIIPQKQSFISRIKRTPPPAPNVIFEEASGSIKAGELTLIFNQDLQAYYATSLDAMNIHGLTSNPEERAMESLRALMTVLASRSTKGRVFSGPVPDPAVAADLKGLSPAEIRYNELPASRGLTNNHIGLVFDTDAHDMYQTLNEAIVSSAYFRTNASKLTDAHHKAILAACELRSVQNNQLNTFSPSQMIRAKLAIELAMAPSAVLVLVDSQLSNDVYGLRALMRALRRVSRGGVAVGVFMMSPLSEVIRFCDSFIALKKSKVLRNIYVPFAPMDSGNGRNIKCTIPDMSSFPLPTYPFSSVLASFALTSSKQAGEKTLVVDNPMLLQSKGSQFDVDAKLLQLISSSNSDVVIVESATEVNLTEAAKPKRSLIQQYIHMQWRIIKESYRAIPVNFGRQITMLFMALFISIMFQGIDDSDLRGSNAKSSIVFMLCTSGSLSALMNVAVNHFNVMREWFYRERLSNYYLPEAYSFSLLSEFAWIAFSSLLFNVLPYAIVPLDWDRFDMHYLIHVLLCLAMCCYGILVAYVAPNKAIFGILCLGFIAFSVLLAGTFVPVFLMPKFFLFVNKLLPIAHAGRAIILNQFFCEGPPSSIPGVPEGCVSFTISLVPGTLPKVWSRYDYFAARWEWSYEQRWDSIRNLAIFVLVYRFVTILAARVYWQKKPV